MLRRNTNTEITHHSVTTHFNEQTKQNKFKNNPNPNKTDSEYTRRRREVCSTAQKKQRRDVGAISLGFCLTSPAGER